MLFAASSTPWAEVPEATMAVRLRRRPASAETPKQASSLACFPRASWEDWGLVGGPVARSGLVPLDRLRNPQQLAHIEAVYQLGREDIVSWVLIRHCATKLVRAFHE